MKGQRTGYENTTAEQATQENENKKINLRTKKIVKPYAYLTQECQKGRKKENIGPGEKKTTAARTNQPEEEEDTSMRMVGKQRQKEGQKNGRTRKNHVQDGDGIIDSPLCYKADPEPLP